MNKHCWLPAVLLSACAVPPNAPEPRIISKQQQPEMWRTLNAPTGAVKREKAQCQNMRADSLPGEVFSCTAWLLVPMPDAPRDGDAVMFDLKGKTVQFHLDRNGRYRNDDTQAVFEWQGRTCFIYRAQKQPETRFCADTQLHRR